MDASPLDECRLAARAWHCSVISCYQEMAILVIGRSDDVRPQTHTCLNVSSSYFVEAIL